MKSEKSLDEAIKLSELLSQFLAELSSNKENLDCLFFEKECIQNCKEPNKIGAGYRPKTLLLNLITIVSCLLAAAGTKITFQYGLYGPDYNTKVITYSTDTGETIETETIKKKLMGSDDRRVFEMVTVETSNPWRKVYDEYTNTEHYERKIDVAVITDSDINDLSEYIDIDLNSIDADIEYITEIEKKNNLSLDELIQGTTQTVTKEIQSKDDYTVGVYADISERLITGIFMYFNVLLTYILSEKSLRSKFNYDFKPLKQQIYEIRSIIKDIKCYKRHDKKRKMRSKLLSSKIKEILDRNSEIEDTLFKLSMVKDNKILLNANKKSVIEIKNHIHDMRKNANHVLKKKL